MVSHIQNALDQATLAALRPITTLLTIVFLIFVVYDYFSISGHAVSVVTFFNVLWTACCLILRLVLGRGNIPARWANGIISALCLFAHSGSLLTLFYTSRAQDTINVMLLIIGAGSFMLSIRWLLFTITIIVPSWLVVAWPLLPADDFLQGGMLLLIGSLVSVAIHITRFRAYWRQELALANARQELRARQIAEEALRESEEKFRSLSEQALVGMMVYQKGRIMYANEACFEMSEYAQPELLALTSMLYAEMIHPDDRDHVMDMLRMTEAGGEHSKQHYTYRLITKSGKTKWIEQWSSPISFEGAPAILIIYFDIDEKKQAEEENKILQESLTQAQRVESIGRLAGGVAHDFNNLLTPILAYSELGLGSIAKGDPLYSDMEQIREAALRAKELTAQLLAFGRKQMLKVQVLDLNELIRKDEKMLKRLIREDIKVVLDLDPELGSVMADSVQMNQILMNLAINAQDAMAEGGELRISTRNVMLNADLTRRQPLVNPGPYIELSVTDTGHGMDQELIGSIFEPFFTTKEKGKGTGLGLATVYGIVKQHDGHVVVESERGRGSTFKIYLHHLQEIPRSRPTGVFSALQVTGNEHILVVEDNDAVRVIVERVLIENGYRVRLANSGEQALELIQSSNDPVDLLLTDVVLSGMNGREVFERANALLPGLRVIFMSGYDDDVIAKHGILDANVQLLAKPFSVRELTQVVRKVLES